MLVFNTFIPQKLSFQHPEVKVVNWPTRPCLGATRNIAITHCTGTHIVILDDDDLIRPHYLGQCAEAMAGREWARVGGMIDMQDRKIVGVSRPATNQLVFSKEAWVKAGRYPEINSGEDLGLLKGLRQKARGGEVKTEPHQYGYCYGWGGGTAHISAYGCDQPNKQDGLLKTQVFARKLLAARKIRAGPVVLRPHFNADYESEILKHFNGKAP